MSTQGPRRQLDRPPPPPCPAPTAAFQAGHSQLGFPFVVALAAGLLYGIGWFIVAQINPVSAGTLGAMMVCGLMLFNRYVVLLQRSSAWVAGAIVGSFGGVFALLHAPVFGLWDARFILLYVVSVSVAGFCGASTGNWLRRRR